MRVLLKPNVTYPTPDVLRAALALHYSASTVSAAERVSDDSYGGLSGSWIMVLAANLFSEL